MIKNGLDRLKAMNLPIIKQTSPSLIANKLVNVQPMSGPVGLAYALRFNTNAEGAIGIEYKQYSLKTWVTFIYAIEGQELKVKTTLQHYSFKDNIKDIIPQKDLSKTMARVLWRDLIQMGFSNAD